MASQPSWIELTEGKQFSRLLYTNPVCFLCTAKETMKSTTKDSELKKRGASRNVMVLSWLTATNNEGKFMFSINRRRYSASILLSTRQFTLSVPVQGMEELLRNVGNVSGQWGSKFPKDHTTHAETNKTTTNPTKPMSKRQKKRQPRFVHGVPGLVAVPLGKENGDSEQQLFCIEGTVAHLVCRVYKIMEDPVIDDDHYLVLADVRQAFVQPQYWDKDKNLFRPKAGASPYLAFFGSQTFGYVAPEAESTEQGSQTATHSTA